MRTLGLLGYGTFAQFLVPHLAPYFRITAYDPHSIATAPLAPSVQPGTLPIAASQEIVLLAMPVQAMEAALRAAAPYIRSDALVLDVASVKMEPVQLMTKQLPATTEIVATHPLFGPQSARDGLQGHRIVVCPVRGERVHSLCAFFRDTLKLQVIQTTPETHDREMATVQALTHFLSRGVRALGLPASDLATPAYQHLLAIGDILKDDSDALFETIQTHNPFAYGQREAFLAALTDIHQSLPKGETS